LAIGFRLSTWRMASAICFWRNFERFIGPVFLGEPPKASPYSSFALPSFSEETSPQHVRRVGDSASRLLEVEFGRRPWAPVVASIN
jgi:hypothetical protein